MKLIACLFVVVFSIGVSNEGALYAQTIEQFFMTTPDSAKPYTWWHWVNGNGSKEGITKDLEAMKAVGIGGSQLFDVGLPVTLGPVVYNSNRFHELMAFAISDAAGAHRAGDRFAKISSELKIGNLLARKNNPPSCEIQCRSATVRMTNPNEIQPVAVG